MCKWLPLGSLFALALGCSSDSKTCVNLDTGGPTFAPAEVKSGATVRATFPVEEGGDACPMQISFDCGSGTTDHTVNVHGNGETDPVTLDCAGAAGPVQCSFGYHYETPNSVTAGSTTTGPTCVP